MALWGCSDSPPALPLEFVFAGRVDGVATFDACWPARVRFARDSGPVHARWNNAPLSVERVAPDSPVFVLGQPPKPGLGTLEISADQGTMRFQARFAVCSADAPVLKPILSLRNAGDTAGAMARLEALATSADDQNRMHLQAERGRLLRRRGDFDGAIDALRRAGAMAVELGHERVAADTIRLAASYARIDRRFDLAGTLLDQSALHVEHNPYMQIRLDWVRASVALDLGQVGTARKLFGEAQAKAEHIADRVALRGMQQSVAFMDQLIGRYRPVEAPPPGARWHLLSNRNWLRYLAMQACAVPPDYRSVLSGVDDAEAAAGGGASVKERANFAVERALNFEALGDLDAARAAAKGARSIDPEGGVEPAALALLEARLLLESDPNAAAEAARQLSRTLAAEGHLGEYTWRADYVLGRALERTGDLLGARVAWGRAVAEVERLSHEAPLHGDRSMFHADRRRLIDAVVDAHLTRGDVAAAFAAAAESTAPVLQTLAGAAHLDALSGAEQKAWSTALGAYRSARRNETRTRARCRTAPAAESDVCAADLRRKHAATRSAYQVAVGRLRPRPQRVSADEALSWLAPDEAILLLHPRRTPRCALEWTTFWLSAGQVSSESVAPVELLQSQSGDIRHLYIVGGTARAHAALRAAGDDAGISVSTAPALAQLRPDPELPGDGTVFGDPTGDLPHARAAATRVARLRHLRPLLGQKATREAFDAATSQGRWVHYDGHGVVSDKDPFAAHLRLADGPFTTTDVLTAIRPLRTAILAGCQTAVSGDLSHLESVGLAEAFLAAGTKTVIAADRLLPDAESARFTWLFHLRDGVARPVEALREVREITALAGDVAAHGWHAYGRR